MNRKLLYALICILFIYLISFASLPCPVCQCVERVTHVSVYSTPPMLDRPVSECVRSRDFRGNWNVETFVVCAEVSPDYEDVSILLQLTLDRSDVLIELADRWRGPLSVAFYLPQDDYHMGQITKLHDENENLRKYADFHVVFENEKYQYPANHLRNVALLNARTDFVITLDVDFVPNPDMHTQLVKTAKQSRRHNKKEVFIIAAFESDSNFPGTKRELLSYTKSGDIFQVHYNKGSHAHLATNYEKWYTADAIYETNYEYSYEPYFLIKRSLCPLFDERFIGYGNDKSSHTYFRLHNSRIFLISDRYELETAEFQFNVLPDPFIIHKNHPSPAWRSGQGSSEAWQLWMDFVRAMKFKYGRIVEVPEWLKQACRNGDCPEFWIYF